MRIWAPDPWGRGFDHQKCPRADAHRGFRDTEALDRPHALVCQFRAFDLPDPGRERHRQNRAKARLRTARTCAAARSAAPAVSAPSRSASRRPPGALQPCEVCRRESLLEPLRRRVLNTCARSTACGAPCEGQARLPRAPSLRCPHPPRRSLEIVVKRQATTGLLCCDRKSQAPVREVAFEHPPASSVSPLPQSARPRLPGGVLSVAATGAPLSAASPRARRDSAIAPSRPGERLIDHAGKSHPITIARNAKPRS